MGLKEILKKNPHLTIEGFQKLQSAYDDRFIAGDFSGFKKIEHTYAHLGKLMGRLAEYVHDVQEGKKASAEELKTKVIPDLLVYSAWLAKEFGVSIESAYLSRFVGNIRRLHADKISEAELAELEKCVVNIIKKTD
ncbi:MAG: hypothetical protein PHH54_04685 [Candidatus Nanoarchaeia archaeon]|nr:hypothetical protein [Candidatus Nanoarchaeia archaeon]MDD5741253.1 hypothetical protein [Candidatus Nanoarchaeia archaeon]